MKELTDQLSFTFIGRPGQDRTDRLDQEKAADMHKSHLTTRTQILLMILFALILSLVVLKYANPLLYPPGRDGGAYMFGGRTVLHGQTLYVDYWEAKGPLILWINAFGLFIGVDSRWGIWLVEYLFWVFSAILGTITLKKAYGLLPALIGITVMMMAGRLLVGAGNFTEEYSLLFTWITVFSFFHLLQKPASRGYPIAMGAMLALNFFIRANNILTSGVLIIIWLVHAARTKAIKGALTDAALVTAGGLIIVIPVTINFLLRGTFVDMITASIIYNFSYSFGTQPGASNLNIIASSLLPALSALGAWLVLPLLGFVIALIQFIRHVFARRMEPIYLALVTIWPLEMLASSISGRSYGHYFLTWLPIMAILSALAIDFTLKHALRRLSPITLPKWVPTLTIGLAVLLFAIIFNQDLARYGDSLARVIFRRDEGVEYIHPVSAFITEQTDPSDLVLVWGGQTGLLFMSERFSSTAYNFYPLYANSRIGRELHRRYFDDLQNNQPKLILDAHIHAPDALPPIDPVRRAGQRIIYPLAENYNEVLDYINAHYTLIFDEDGYQIYQINEP
jgi:hypothetical protein